MSKVCLCINVLILLIGALVAAADDNMTAVRIQLQWVPQAQFAGYYVAQELGFYEAVGLDVTSWKGPLTSPPSMSCLPEERTWA